MATTGRAILLAAVGLLCASCGRSSERAPMLAEPSAPAVDDAAAAAAPAPPPDAGEPRPVAAPIDTPLPESWSAVPGLTDAVALEELGDRMCALRRAGTVTCWSVELDDDRRLDLTPSALPHMSSVVAISSAKYGDELCAVDNSGRVRCIDTSDGKARPVTIAGLREVVAVDLHYLHGCALNRRGQVRCWGRGAEARPGKPQLVAGMPPLVSLQLDSGLGCGLDRQRRPWCWRDPSDGGERLAVSIRSCQRGLSYYPGDDRDDVCQEAAAAPVGPVEELVVSADGEPGELFYARIGGAGYYARYDKAYSDNRPMSKDSRGAATSEYMERFPLPEGTVRLVGESKLVCAVTGADATYCWRGPFGEMPRLTTMPTPVAVALSGDVVCALTAAGAVSCASPDY